MYKIFLIAAAFLALAISAAAAKPATFGILWDFDSSGGEPRNVEIDPDGNVIGFEGFGGAHGLGSVFSLTPDGHISIIYDFTGGSDGGLPNFIKLAPNGLIDVTTQGTTACGKLVEIMPDGTTKTPLDFNGPNGCMPNSVIFCTKSILCGTTQKGGSTDDGVLYEIKPASPHPREDIVADFSGSQGGCARPGGSVVRLPDGTIYGTTETGGRFGRGCIYELTPNGDLKSLYDFNGADGDNPIGKLAYNSALNTLEGTTFSGGAYGEGVDYEYNLSTNTFTLLQSFNGNGSDRRQMMMQANQPTSGVPGANPNGGVIVDKKGNIFGTTVYGGGGACDQGCGEVFEITAKGKFKVLHAFNGTDGEYPVAAPALDKHGNLYGTTLLGGTGGFGVVYRITP